MIILNSILSIRLRTGNLSEEAYRYGIAAIEIYERYGDSSGKANVQYLLAFQCFISHQMTQAFELYMKCFATFEKIGDVQKTSSVLLSLGNVSWRLGDYTGAMEYFKRSQEIAIANDLHNQRAGVLVGMGNLYGDKGEFDLAITCYNESIGIARTLNSNVILPPALLGLAGISKILGDYQKAIPLAQEAEEKFMLQNNLTGASHCLELLSGIYFEKGEYEKSILISTQIIKLLDKTGHRRTVAGAWNNIAGVYAVENNHIKGIESYHRALEIYLEINDKRGICIVYSNLAEQYLKADDLMSASDYVSRAIEVAEENNFIDLEIEVISVHATIAIAKHEYSNVLSRYSDVVEKCIKLNHKRGIALLNSLVGDVQKAQQCYHLAKEFYVKSLVMAEELGDKPLVSKIHHSLSQVYEYTNDMKKAIEHFKEYHRKENEIFNEKSDKRIKNLLVLHETETAQKESNIFRLQSTQLKAENEYKSRELSSLALHLVQKNEMLESLLEKAKQMVGSPDGRLRELAEEMVQKIQSNRRDDNSWMSFYKQFTQFHSRFIQVLTDSYPKLTPMEVKICTLLKIQLTTKDIAAALVLSARTVEDHRNRIRKKIGLSKKDNLSTFLISLE